MVERVPDKNEVVGPIPTAPTNDKTARWPFYHLWDIHLTLIFKFIQPLQFKAKNGKLEHHLKGTLTYNYEDGPNHNPRGIS